MSARHAGLLVVFALAAVGVLADYFLKLASERTNSAQSKWFWLGLSVYALMAGGWVYVMRHLSFAQIGIVYSVSTILLLIIVGTLVLKETLHLSEILGVAMAVGALLLLARLG
ncbi:MAG: transporter [Acidobacteria bacterium]|nr:transporter [Acidobacteriota bacterium]